MALSDSYASVPQLKAAKAKLLSDDDLALARGLRAIARLIDLKANQPYGFNRDQEVTTRIYAPGDQMAPIAVTTDLVVKASSGWPIVWADVDALVRDTDFELLPRNPRDGWPHTSIRLVGWSSTPPSVFTPQTYMPTDYRVQVTAFHGWPSVPDAIVEANMELLMILRGESPFATDRITELDTVVNASPQARAILRDLYQLYNPWPIGVG